MVDALTEFEQRQYKRVLEFNTGRAVDTTKQMTRQGFYEETYFFKRSFALKKSAGFAIFLANSALISFSTCDLTVSCMACMRSLI